MDTTALPAATNPQRAHAADRAPPHQAAPPPPPTSASPPAGPPPDFARQRPQTLPSGASYTLSTTPANDGAHLASIYCVALFPSAPPSLVFDLLTHPGACAAGVWRDVKALNERLVESEAAPGAGGDPPGSRGVRSVLVTQVGEVRLAIKTLRFETHLRVVEDGRGAGAGAYATHFSLARPGGALRRFHGTWALAADEAGTGTAALLTQEVCPAGVPPGLNNVPVIGRLVRGACSRAVRRMVEDLAGALDGVEKGAGGVDAWIESRTTM